MFYEQIQNKMTLIHLGGKKRSYLNVTYLYSSENYLALFIQLIY